MKVLLLRSCLICCLLDCKTGSRQNKIEQSMQKLYDVSWTCKVPVGLGDVLDIDGSSLPISWLNLVSLGPRTTDRSS